jgi:hypothetical protein
VVNVRRQECFDGYIARTRELLDLRVAAAAAAQIKKKKKKLWWWYQEETRGGMT